MRRSVRRHAMPLILAGVMVGAAACGGGESSSAASDNESLDCADAAAAEGDPTTIRIGYGRAAEEPVWLMDAMPDVAPQQGEAYALEMRKYDNSENKVTAYQAGEVDMVIVPAPAMVVGTARGALDLVTLLTVNVEAGDAGQINFLVRPDSGIESFADLKDRVIGLHSLRSTPDFLTRMALEDAGLTEEDVELAVVPFPAQQEALASGVIDAAALPEPFVTLALNSENPPEVLTKASDIIDYSYENLILAVDRQFAAENLAAVCALRDDYAEVLEYYESNIEESRRAIVDAGYVDLPIDVYQQVEDYTLPEAGAFDPTGLEQFLEDMISVGLLEEAESVEVEELYVPGLTAGT